MKKINDLTFFLAFLFLFVACQSEKEKKKKENGLMVIAVNDLTGSTIKASTYFKNATVVPLETSDNCLLDRLEKIVLYNNRLYVLDNRNQAGIFCFDMNGKLLNIIGSQGVGPYEHASLTDFCLDKKDGRIYLNDRNRKRILVFTVEGEYIKSIAVDDFFTKIEIFDEHLYLAENRARGNSYDLEVKNMSGKTIGKYFLSPNEKIQPPPQLMKSSHGIYYYPNRSQDSVYSIFDSNPELLFYVDFGKHAIKRADWEKITDLTYVSTHPFWQTLVQNDYIGGFSSVFIFDKLIVFGFTYQMNASWKAFYDKSAGKTSVTCTFIDDLSYLGFNYMVSQTDNQLICAEGQPDLARIIENMEDSWAELKYLTPEEVEKGVTCLRALQNKITDDANPIVVIYDLK